MYNQDKEYLTVNYFDNKFLCNKKEVTLTPGLASLLKGRGDKSSLQTSKENVIFV